MSRSLPEQNKNLGQHYLKSSKVIQSICQDFNQGIDAIVEVGPGPGILTATLAKREEPLFVIDKDQRFHNYLSELIPENNILITDCLKLDWQQYLEQNQLRDKNIWLVSNLPYNISSQLLIQFLQVPNIKMMTLMFQKEVGVKVLPDLKVNGMGSLHALTASFFETKKVVHLIK